MVGGREEPKVLIKWQGLLDWESTWKPVAAIRLQFPTFNLEGKIVLKEEEGGGVPLGLLVR